MKYRNLGSLGCGNRQLKWTRTLLILSALVWTGPALEAANPLNLEIAATPDGPSTEQGGVGTTEIKIDLGANESGSTSFWLRHGGEPLEGVALAIVEPNEKATVVPKVPAQKDGKFTAAALQRVEVEVSKVTLPGTFRATILASQGETSVTLGTLEIKRDGTLSVTGTGVTSTEISTATDRERSSHPYFIVSDDPAERVAALEIDPFIGPNGATGTVIHLDGKRLAIYGEQGAPPPSSALALKVPPHGQVPLAISVKLPVEGEYSSALRLRLPDGRTAFSRTLKVTRTKAETPVFAIQAPATTEIPDLGWLGSSTTATFDLSVTENNRAPVEIESVQLLFLHLVKGAKTTEADRGSLEVWLDGKRVNSFEIERNMTATPEIRIPGLTQAGQYSGTVRLTSGNLKPVDQIFTLFVSRSWWLAFFAITVGVLIAAVLRYLGVKKGQYAIQTKLEGVRGKLRAIEVQNRGMKEELTHRLGAVLHRVSRRLDHLDAMVRRNPGVDLAAELTEVADRVDGPLLDWLDLLRLADREGLLATVDHDLVTVEIFLDQWGSNANQVAETEKKLDSIQTVIGQNSVSELKDMIANQIKVVKAQRSVLPSSKDHEIDNDVLGNLQTAANEAGMDAKNARNLFEKAWRAWIGLLVEQVVSDLPAEKDYPFGFADKAAWAKVRTKAKAGFEAATAAADPAASRIAYREALEDLLESLIAAFQSGLSDAKAAAGTPAPGDTAKENFLEKLAEIEGAAKQSLGEVAGGKLEQARSTYQGAVKAFVAAKGSFAKTAAGFQMGAGANPASLPTSEPGGAPALQRTSRGFRGQGRTVLDGTDAARRLARRQLAVTAIWFVLAAFVIGLVGLQVLYLDAVTWGSLRDFIVAVLWGLGLHTGTAAVTTAAVNRFGSVPGAS